MAGSRVRIAIGVAIVAGTVIVAAAWVVGPSMPASAPPSASASVPGAGTPRTTDAPPDAASGASSTASSAAATTSSSSTTTADAPTPDVPLDLAIAEAYEIRSSGRRDEALSRLVGIGLARRDHPAALQAAAGVSDFARRDALLDRVSCRAMRAGDEATVRKATTRAFSPALREEISQRLATMTQASGAPGARAGSCTGPD